MSNWKQQIDQELGNEPRFSNALEKKIITLATTKKQRTFKQPLIYAVVCIIILTLFITAPKQAPKDEMASSAPIALNNLMEQDKIKAVYTSYINSDKNQFYARNNTFALGVNKLSKKEMLQLEEEFQSARLDHGTYVNENRKLMVPYGYDVIVQFESGIEKKLRVITGFSGTTFYDVDTKLTYRSGFYKGVLYENYKSSLTWSKILIVLLLVLSLLFVFVSPTNRAPASLRIYVGFIGLLSFIGILLKFNLNISIWVPVAYLILSCLIRYVKLRDSHYSEDKLLKIKRANWLLVIMWSIVLLQQFLGGI